ncbi:unnamed protein product [Ixodes hexagonus]
MPLGRLATATGRRLTAAGTSTLTFRRTCFYKSSRKEDYERPEIPNTTPYAVRIREGLRDLKTEFGLLKDEWVEKLRCDPKYYYHGDNQVLWKFDSAKTVADWLVTADSDNNEGYSTARFSLGPGGTGVFEGHLDTRKPKDGRVLHAGYCNIRSPRASRSFGRTSSYNWTPFTHLVLRVRGDGRAYMLNLGIDGHMDLTWHLMYNFILYTRGGPYWQTAKIPFSRFFLSNKGRIQDKQGPLPRSNVRSLGITCADGVPGPFRLEIDYVAGHVDEAHTEEFAYEMYEMPTNYVPGY